MFAQPKLVTIPPGCVALTSYIFEQEIVGADLGSAPGRHADNGTVVICLLGRSLSLGFRQNKMD